MPFNSYVVDSSVLVATLVFQDKYHNEGSIVVDKIVSSNDVVFASALIPIEICAAVSRRRKASAGNL